MTTTVTAHLRDPFDGFFSGYDPADTYIEAIAWETTAATPIDAAEEAFHKLNVGTDEVAQQYRAAGHRSLSVGDVVVVDADGPVALVCARFGWQLLPEFVPAVPA